MEKSLLLFGRRSLRFGRGDKNHCHFDRNRAHKHLCARWSGEISDAVWHRPLDSARGDSINVPPLFLPLVI